MVIFQGDGYHVVLRPRGAGLPGDVPVCGLWGEHHLLAWACAGLPVKEAKEAQASNTAVTEGLTEKIGLGNLGDNLMDRDITFPY